MKIAKFMKCLTNKQAIYKFSNNDIVIEYKKGIRSQGSESQQMQYESPGKH